MIVSAVTQRLTGFLLIRNIAKSWKPKPRDTNEVSIPVTLSEMPISVVSLARYESITSMEIKYSSAADMMLPTRLDL